MATLPTKDNLSGPVSLRSGRAIASVDTTAIGRGIASAGGAIAEIGADMMKQQTAVDLSMSEAKFTEDSLNLENRYQDDPEYETFGKRAPQELDRIVQDAGALITDSRTRERWMADAKVRAVRLKDGITDIGRRKYQEAKTVGLDGSLQRSVNIYTDPETPDDVKAKVRADIEGSIAVAEETGLLSPEQAAQRRTMFLEGADFTRAKLIAASDPDAIAGIAGNSANDVAKSLLRDTEGFRSTPYWDVNAYRVGYGSDTVTKADGSVVRVKPGMTVTRADAERDLSRRSKEFAKTAQRQVGVREWGALPANAQAALTSVAYNYGSLPASVVNSVKSGDIASVAAAVAALGDDNGGVNAGRRAREASIILGESGAPEPDWYKRLSPMQRQQVNDEANTQRAENARIAAATAKAEYVGYKDKVELDILTGGVKSEVAIVADSVLNDGDKASLLRTFRTQNEENAGVNELLFALANDSQVNVNQFDADQARIGDKTYKRLMEASSEDQKLSSSEAFVRQTGYVPKTLAAELRQGLASTQPSVAGAGMERAARLYQIAPSSMATGDNASALKDAAIAYQEYVYGRGMSRDEAGQRWVDLHSPEALERKQRLKEPAKDFLKTLAVFDVTGALDTSILPFTDPDAGLTMDQQTAIMSDYAKIAEEKFIIAGGDADLAKKLALADMSKLYGVSEVSGSDTVMKFPPEKYYPAVGGDHAYIRAAALADIKTVAPDAENVMLTPTKETADDIRLGRPPRYGILYQRPDGVWDQIPGQRFSIPADELSRQIGEERQMQLDSARRTNAAAIETQDREAEAQRAYDEALQSTVGTDAMKAQAASDARQRVLMNPSSQDLEKQAKRQEQTDKAQLEREQLAPLLRGAMP